MAGWTCTTCGHGNPSRAKTCRGDGCPAGAADRSLAARIAVNTSWARTPVRAERTEAARRNSPGRVEYWEARIRDEGRVAEADISAAAENARRAYMAGLVKKRRDNARARAQRAA